MNLHLAEITKQVAPGAHAVLLLDQAGWHLSSELNTPANITIVPLPACQSASKVDPASASKIDPGVGWVRTFRRELC